MKSITIERCSHCRLTVHNGNIRWLCDDFHPEVLAFLEQQEEENNDEAFQEAFDHFNTATCQQRGNQRAF